MSGSLTLVKTRRKGGRRDPPGLDLDTDPRQEIIGTNEMAYRQVAAVGPSTSEGGIPVLIAKSKLFGGSGGIAFCEAEHRIARIARIIVYYSQYVHRLEVTYALDNGEVLPKAYGSPGDAESAEIILEDDEKICAAIVRSGQYVDSLALVTYRMFNLIGMKRYGPFGGSGGQASIVLSPNIREFYGRAGDLLDAIGFRGEDPLLAF